MIKDLGLVAIMPWTNLYPLFNEKINNFNGKGGYKLFEKKCYILLNGSVSGSLTLPIPVSPFDLTIYKNNKIETIKNYNGTIALENNDKIVVETVYDVKG